MGEDTLGQLLARHGAESFPEAILGPWVSFAAREAPGWKAGMFPLLGSDQPPLFWLERRRPVKEGPTLVERLTSEDQRALVLAARAR